jgi:hypothetical protein
MKSLLARYRRIPNDTLRVIAVKFLGGMINTAFMIALNLFLRKRGLDDVAIGGIVAFQYAGGLVLSLPEGLYLRGRRLKPFLVAGAILVPVLAVVSLVAFQSGQVDMGKWLLLLWSMSLLQLESFTLPYIVRSHHKESEPEAISLAYSMYAFGSIVSGILIAVIKRLPPLSIGDWPILGDEFGALLIIALIAAPGFLLLLPVREAAPDPHGRVTARNLGIIFRGYDWRRIAVGLVPTSLLAIGAGFTIPFVNLFFNGVFGVDSDLFAVVAVLTSMLTATTALLVPGIRRRYGYMVAIPLVQSLAVLMLLLMALTEMFADVPGMWMVAVGFFMLRSPLMNMAGPMSNELVMNYVGRRNQDLTGALHAAIWSGAWFVSAGIFREFRAVGMPYFQIFLITVGLYVIAIGTYVWLIRSYQRREGLVE